MFLDGIYKRLEFEHSLRNHGLVGNFHIIGIIYDVFTIRAMGLFMSINFIPAILICSPGPRGPGHGMHR